MTGSTRTDNGMQGAGGRVAGPVSGTGGGGRPARRRQLPLRRAAAITAALAGVAILAAACSSPKSPAAGGGKSPSGAAARALAYTTCMRSHGISDFPDPTIHGNSIGLKVGAHAGNSDLNLNNPAYRAASQACRSLAPGGLSTQAPSAQQLAAGVKFAACMRSHGFPTWPDPDSHGVFNLPATISAQFGSAAKTCQSQTHLNGLRMRQRAPGGGS